jgi:hypothetical protein
MKESVKRFVRWPAALLLAQQRKRLRVEKELVPFHAMAPCGCRD